VKYTEILQTYNAGDIAFIKSILDGEGIEYYFRGEHFNAFDPLVQPSVLLVMEDQAPDARELLEGLNLRIFGVQ